MEFSGGIIQEKKKTTDWKKCMICLFIYVPLFHYMGLIFDSLMLFFRIKCSNLIFFDIQKILEPKIFRQEVKKINQFIDGFKYIYPGIKDFILRSSLI